MARPDSTSCQESLDIPSTGFVTVLMTDHDFTHDTDSRGCLEFCQGLPDYAFQTGMQVNAKGVRVKPVGVKPAFGDSLFVFDQAEWLSYFGPGIHYVKQCRDGKKISSGMMWWPHLTLGWRGNSYVVKQEESCANTANTCSCLYSSDKVPNKDLLPEHAIRSPPKFSLQHPSLNWVLGLDLEAGQCNATEIQLVYMENTNSPSQQFRLTLEGQIASVRCPRMVLVPNVQGEQCSNGDGIVVKDYTNIGLNAKLGQWKFNIDPVESDGLMKSGTITNAACGRLQVSSVRKRGVLNSFYFSLNYKDTGLSIGVAGESCSEGQGLELQETKFGEPSQQFYFDDHKRLVSLLCGHAIGHSSGCDFNDTLTLQNIKTVNSTVNGWEITADKAIQSLQCPDVTIGVNTGSMSINEIWSSQFTTYHSAQVQKGNSDAFSLSTKGPEELAPDDFDTTKNPTNATQHDLTRPKAGSPVVVLISSAQKGHWHKKHQRIQINKGPFAMKNRAGKVLGLLKNSCPFEQLELQDDDITNPGQQFYSTYKKGSDFFSLFSVECPGLAISHNIDQNVTQVSLHPYVIENKDHHIAVDKDTNHTSVVTKWRLRRDGAIESARFPGLLFHVDSRNDASNAIFLANKGDIGDGSVHSWRQINTRCEVDGLLASNVAFCNCI